MPLRLTTLTWTCWGNSMTRFLRTSACQLRGSDFAQAQGPRLHYPSARPAPGAGAAHERHRRLIATSLLLHFRPLRKLARGEKGMERCLAHRPRRVQHGEGYPDIGILDHSKTREGRRRLRPAGARDPVPGARRWIFSSGASIAALSQFAATRRAACNNGRRPGA